MHKQDLIQWPSKEGGGPEFRRYLESAPGQPIQDVITDIDPINSMAQERLGYPTQKPITLLEQILAASSNEGDVVLDPFCGCGTTIEAAEKLKRQWMGIDVTHYAVTLIEERLRKLGVADKTYNVAGRPTVMREAIELARRDKYQFQWWASWRLGAQVYQQDEKRGADRGIDGNIFYHNGPYGTGRIIVSVKGGENVGVKMVRDLRGVIEREEAEMGILVTLAEPTGPDANRGRWVRFVRKSAHGQNTAHPNSNHRRYACGTDAKTSAATAAGSENIDSAPKGIARSTGATAAFRWGRDCSCAGVLYRPEIRREVDRG